MESNYVQVFSKNIKKKLGRTVTGGSNNFTVIFEENEMCSVFI